MTEQEQTKIQSVFESLYDIQLEKSSMTVKEISNSEWSDEIKAQKRFYLEQKDRTKKGLVITKKDFETLTSYFKEISEK